MVCKDLAVDLPGVTNFRGCPPVLSFHHPHAGLGLRSWPHPLAGLLPTQTGDTTARKENGVTHLSGQLRGHLRGQAVGQGSRGRGHMLLKAVDARLFGGLGAG